MVAGFGGGVWKTRDEEGDEVLAAGRGIFAAATAALVAVILLSVQQQSVTATALVSL